MKEKALKFLKKMKAPATFLDITSITKVLVMLFPSYCVKNLGSRLGMESLTRQAADEAINLYFTIFKENSKKSREKFFSQALI